jgi:nucleotide sugar dehydrogenase
MDYSINIIGHGYVGGAMSYVCDMNNIKYNVCDMKYETNEYYYNNINNLLEKETNKRNYYFICVPTPSKENGECNVEIVKEVISKINKKIKEDEKKHYIIIKSTVEPKTCDKINKEITKKNIKLIFCPEFLREKTYLDDIYNTETILLGFSGDDINEDDIKKDVIEIFKEMFKHKEINFEFKKYEECELFKYMLNVFLAVKVWYFNEIYNVCKKLDIEYDSFTKLYKYDARIGGSHTQVPGHDGLFGFGGKCLPKEIKGMHYLLSKLNLKNEIFEKIIKRNEEMRFKK